MIVKCPECGHDVSDQAPTCPNCGVRIAGRIIHCPNCGHVYFSNQAECPACHHPTPRQSAQTPPPVPAGKGSASTPQQPSKSKGCRGKTVFIVSLVIALLICGSMYFFYNQAQNSKEQEEYETALGSTDPQVLQQYLDDYSGVNSAHTDSIQAHLQRLRQSDQDYANALATNSKTALQQYLETHPATTHRGEILNKIDSLDWAFASSENTQEAYQAYLDEHGDGLHVAEARDKVSQLDATTVKPEEKQKVQSALRSFFQAINSKNESKLRNSVSMVLDSFLGKTDATQDDVVEYMNMIYKSDVKNLNFHLGTLTSIEKHDVGGETFEYEVKFPAKQVTETIAGEEVDQYRITAVVDSNGKISSMSMKRLIEE